MKKIIYILPFIIFLGCKDERSEQGDTFFKNGQYQKAVDSYTEYLKLNPADEKTLYNRGRAYEELGKIDAARADFNTVVKDNPNHINALLSLAQDYYTRQDDYENTIYFAEKVIQVDNNSAQAHTLKGKGHQKLGELEKAMAAYNAALSVNDNFADAYLARGSLRIYLKQISRACADLKVANGLGADQAEPLIKKYCN